MSRWPPHEQRDRDDRGSHYAGTSYQRVLAAHGGIASMNRRGNCWDNAVVESFFATLKTELVANAHWRRPAEGIAALSQYLVWYDDQRRHSTLGYVSPAAFERQPTATETRVHAIEARPSLQAASA